MSGALTKLSPRCEQRLPVRDAVLGELGLLARGLGLALVLVDLVLRRVGNADALLVVEVQALRVAADVHFVRHAKMVRLHLRQGRRGGGRGGGVGGWCRGHTPCW